MRQQLFCSGCESLESPNAPQPPIRPANRTASRWRAALDTLIGAPVRLHRYRHLHAEVIEDALHAFDCGPERRKRS